MLYHVIGKAMHFLDHTIICMTRVAGRISIANADAGAAAFTNTAIDQAERAVHDLLTGRGWV